MTVPRIAITSGEPAGIGPELCLQLAKYTFDAELVVIADPDILQLYVKRLNLSVSLIEADLSAQPEINQKGVIKYIPCNSKAAVIPGKLDVRNASYVVDTLQVALDGCLSSVFDAVVTAPVHKGIINDAGMAFTGHTEFFADGAGVEKVVMMLATADLKVALATTHLPLAKVSEAITQQSLSQVLAIIQSSFESNFKINSPRIAVCGLNPHAGEDGHLGMEEIEVISPVIDAAKSFNENISGPWPADTIFVKEKLHNFDVVLAMYHDQGLPVLKHEGFGKAVNITLGLPFIRASVDHGTALDLAGTGEASVTSLLEAIKMTVDLCH